MHLLTKNIRRRAYKIFGVTLAVASLVGWLQPAHVLAAGEQNITITPASKELKVEPGGSASARMTVVNQGADAFSVDLSASPYSVQDESYEPKFKLPNEGALNASSWVELSTHKIDSLNPGKMVDVNYTVKVPSSTPAGSYYFVVFAESTPKAPAAGGITAHNRVGQIIYLTVNGDLKIEGDASFPTIPTVVTSTNYEIPIVLKNSGTAYYNSKTTVEVKDIFGKGVYNSTQDRYVIPGVDRRVIFDWRGYLPIGVYTVERSAALPDGNTKKDTTTVVVVYPITAGGILLLLAIVAALWRVGRAKKTRKR